MKSFKLKRLPTAILSFAAVTVPQFIGTVIGVMFLLVPMFTLSFNCRTERENTVASLLLYIYLGAALWCCGWPASLIGFLPDGWLWQILYGFITVVLLFVFLSLHSLLCDSIAKLRGKNKYSRS